MSVELEEAKVQVAAFQKQCEEFLVVIVQQKREADEQQKVSVIVYYCRVRTGELYLLRAGMGISHTGNEMKILFFPMFLYRHTLCVSFILKF